MFDFTAGYNATWDNNNDCPVKEPPPRIFPNKHPLYDEAEWLRGYDAGLEASKCYNEGLTVGLINGPDKNPYKDDRNWSSGWYRGRVIWLRRQIKPILKTAGKLGLMVCEVRYPDRDERDGIDYPGGEKYKPLKKSDLLNACIESLMGRYGRTKPLPTTIEEIIRIFTENGESDWGHVRVLSVADYKKEKAEKEYDEIERAAQHFASRCNKKIGTKDFIRALDRAVHCVRRQKEQWNNPEVRMEEWAACMYAGVGSETYFDDLNFENGRYELRQDELQKVWDYLERKFPIMMLRYHEAKARKKKK